MRRTRRPTLIRHEDQDVSVRYVPRTAQFPEGYSLSGEYFPKATGGPRIDIVTPSRSVGRTVLVHEILHHIWRQAGFHRKFSGRTEELIIGDLATDIVHVLRRNPALVKYITEGSDAG